MAGMSHLKNAIVLLVIGASTAMTACTPDRGPPPKMASSSASSEGFASCPRDSTVVGGGYEIEPAARVSGRPPTVVVNRPTETGWKVECVDPEGKTVKGCRAFVLCASIL